MKTLLVFFMAIAAINALFFGDNSRAEFLKEMERIFSKFHGYGPSGNPIPQDPPIRMSELIKALDQWNAITDDERNAIKNYLFGQKFPRPMPASHHEKSHPEFSEEKLRELREKWEAMTPEEREEIRNNKRKEDHQRFPRPMPAHHNEKNHRVFDETKLKEIREKWEAMTQEEREEMIKNHKQEHGEAHIRHPRSIQPIQPLPELLSFLPYAVRAPSTGPVPKPASHKKRNHPKHHEDKLKEMRAKWEAMTPEEREEILKNHKRDHGEAHARHPRSIQPIMPLPEFLSFLQHPKPERPIVRHADDFGRTRPVDSIARPIERLPTILPIAASKRIDLADSIYALSAEDERLRDLFPNGLPIRPIGMIPMNKFNDILSDVVENSVETEIDEFVPIQPAAKENQPQDEEVPEIIRSRRTREIQPILPISSQPILPIKSQPILPIKSQPILPIKSQPILPISSQPILPIKSQTILPIKSQPILPLKAQPILPLP